MPQHDGYPSQAGLPAHPSGGADDVTEIACEGEPGADAHPMVYMTFGDEDEIRCPYCSRRFRRSDAAPGPAH